MNEQWKPVIGYEGLYEVSIYGRVRRTSNGGNWPAGHFMTLQKWPPVFNKKNATRYWHVNLSKDNKRRGFYIHRLVMAAFVGTCPDGYQTHHKDGNGQNNRLENLEYVTRSQNMKYKYQMARHSHVGSKNPCARLTEKSVKQIRERYANGETQCVIAKAFGVSQVMVSRIILRKSWAHVE